MTTKLDTRGSPSIAVSVWGMSVWLGAMHALVDLATVSSVFRVARRFDSSLLTPFAIIVGYDIVAFALQAPLGAIADRFKAQRAAMLLGLALALAAVQAVPYSTSATMAMAGLGNALFHLGAGAIVLSRARGRSAPAGLFVAPGALGLTGGLVVGRHGTGSLFPIALGLGVAIAAAAFLSTRPEPAEEPPPPAIRGRGAVAAVLLLLLVSVLVRSFVGFGGSYRCPKTEYVLWGSTIAAVGGKAIGGFLADRFGWLTTSVGALIVSAPLIAFSQGSPAVVLPAMLIFQTTMPVTLTAVYRLMPSRPALAFGLPCVALIGGALPTFYPWGKGLYGSATFLTLILLSAATLYVALRAKGLRQSQAVALAPA